jgi:hypothetical protein
MTDGFHLDDVLAAATLKLDLARGQRLWRDLESLPARRRAAFSGGPGSIRTAESSGPGLRLAGSSAVAVRRWRSNSRLCSPSWLS